MIKQYRHGNNHLELEVPGGCIDADDLNPESAAARELLEETGYQGKPGIMIGKTCPNPALQNNWCHTIFIADAVKSSKALMEDTEDIQTLIIPLKDIGSLIDNQEITHGLVLNAIHFYERFAKRHIGQ
jgi:8-oxo-dGTP pyrophosphatase MutT (NUDIX family)